MPQTGWDVVLVWFMRLTALFWLAKARRHLGQHPRRPARRPRPSNPSRSGARASIVYFAVIDSMAAVGLWLTSAWGGVVWLLAATSALTLAVLTPQLLPMSRRYLAIQGRIIALYFILSFLAATGNPVNEGVTTFASSCIYRQR